MPLLRLLFVILIMSGFAAGFAELVRRSDRPDAGASASARCGEAVGVPCPSRTNMD